MAQREKVTEITITEAANLNARIAHLTAEMYRRAEVYDLTYHDDLAVRAAIAKAAMAGYQAGQAEMAHVINQGGGHMEVAFGPLCDTDIYADEFGDDLPDE